MNGSAIMADPVFPEKDPESGYKLFRLLGFMDLQGKYDEGVFFVGPYTFQPILVHSTKTQSQQMLYVKSFLCNFLH